MRQVNYIIFIFISVFCLAIQVLATNSTLENNEVKTDSLLLLNELEVQGKSANLDAQSMALARAIMVEILSNSDVYNTLTVEDGHLVLDESNTQFALSQLKEKLDKLLVDTVNYGLAKYDRFQEKLDEKMPNMREGFGDVIATINNTLGKVDPALVGKIVKLTGELIGGSCGIISILGAAFGVPVIPGKIVKYASVVLGNPYTVSGMLAGAKTILDIIEELARVSPNDPPQSDEEKGAAAKKVLEAIHYVAKHFLDNFSTYKPEEVKKLKEAMKEVAYKIFSMFL